MTGGRPTHQGVSPAGLVRSASAVTGIRPGTTRDSGHQMMRESVAVVRAFSTCLPGLGHEGLISSLDLDTSSGGTFLHCRAVPEPDLRGGLRLVLHALTRRSAFVSSFVSSAAYACLRADARANGETRRPVRRSLTVRARRWSVRGDIRRLTCPTCPSLCACKGACKWLIVSFLSRA